MVGALGPDRSDPRAPYSANQKGKRLPEMEHSGRFRRKVMLSCHNELKPWWCKDEDGPPYERRIMCVGRGMSTSAASRLVRFLRNYLRFRPMITCTTSFIQRALRRHRIEPLVLPAQFLDQLLENLRSDAPCSEILTGTAGDGKTYHCREAWVRLGGSDTTWNTGDKIQRLQLGLRELVIVKDLSELRAEESASLLSDMAQDVICPEPERIYLIAANHGQLLEKLKAAPATAALLAMVRAVEELLVTGENPDPEVRHQSSAI